MKKIIPLLFTLFFALLTQAQVSKTVNLTASGTLSTSISTYDKYFELKIEIKGKPTLDKEITFKYQLKNISDKTRNLCIVRVKGLPVDMGIQLINKSGIPLEYTPIYRYVEYIIKPSIDDYKTLKPGETFEGEVSLHSALVRDRKPFFLPAGKYVLKVNFFDLISNEVSFKLENIPEFHTIYFYDML